MCIGLMIFGSQKYDLFLVVNLFSFLVFYGLCVGTCFARVWGFNILLLIFSFVISRIYNIYSRYTNNISVFLSFSDCWQYNIQILSLCVVICYIVI